jgi:TPR repeat protein
MNDGYYLARSAYHKYLLGDAKPTRKVLSELNGTDHAHASLVEAVIRLKHERRFEEPEAILAAFTKAGKLGIAFGYFHAGECYVYGTGGTKNRRAAVRLYRKGAENGSISAMLALGNIYSRGDGVARDSALALTFFRQAASARVPYIDRGATGRDGTILDTVYSHEDEAQTQAMEQLGILYRDGEDGIAQDIASAHFWLRRAADNGSASAKSCLRKLPPAPPRPQKPPVVRAGVPIVDHGGMLNGLGSEAAYLEGKTYSVASQPDYKLAARYFQIAAQLGHPDAKPALQAVKATVGERAFSLFFAGWSPAEPASDKVSVGREA